MSRSLKKGPFVDPKLLKRIEDTKAERIKVAATPPEASYLADLAELRKELVKKIGGPPAPPTRRARVAAPPVAEVKPTTPPPVVAPTPEKPKEFDLLSYFK